MNKKIYRTSDMPFAAYLNLNGYFYDLEPDEFKAGKMIFCFEEKKGMKIEDELNMFRRKELTVEPQKYFDSIKEVKARLYA
jgi:hypothetical protein